MAKIATIGCGLVGQGWAAVFAQAGFDVAMYDASAEASERALASMEPRISDLAEFCLVNQADIAEIMARIKVAATLEEALEGAVYVQENGPERLDAKRSITQTLDASAGPDVPIGSSTSGIVASRYCEKISGRHRCLVVHPINPPHLIPAVEIVPSCWTDAGITTRVAELMAQCGRETIILKEEIDGFVVNRLQGALLEESFRLIGSGVVSATDLDKAISHGLGLRWSFMGPIETIHLNSPEGITQYVERYGAMYRNLGIGNYDAVDWEKIAKKLLDEEFAQKIPVSKIADAQVARDRKLMALLRHKAQKKSTEN